MNLRQYLKGLKKLVREHGDSEVVYASDEEGNSFHKVFYTPSVGFYKNGEYYPADAETKESIEKKFGKEHSAVCVN